jgi:ATP-binding cassette subfamily C protein
LTASQAQYLALARVLLLTPEIVILDEATAEVGSGAARALGDAARTVVSGRSGLIIAHPATQATTADIILVMDHSRVAERGSHKELVARNGRYAELRRSWTANR